jgi:glucose-6-phosphate 1-dehydrogenase
MANDDTADTPRQAPPAALVVFGASGDLAARKLFPALARLAERDMLTPQLALVGVARTKMSDQAFADHVRKATSDAGPLWEEIVSGARYVAGGYDDPDTYDRLSAVLDDLDRSRGTAGNRLFYLAAVPTVFPDIIQSLGRFSGRDGVTGAGGSGDSDRDGKGFCRLVVEKPYGRDLASAEALDDVAHANFDESQIYRIDHYLGKETVQNVLALRFANAVFEPIWDRRYVDHVQVTVAEADGVGSRAGFYESAGAIRDIVQNHVMQVLAITSMEPPAHVDAEGIRDEKVKALKAINTPSPEQIAVTVVRAQYGSETAEGEEATSYREEHGVDPNSQTETFVAMKLEVDNWRWAGVPFYVRTGKHLAKRATEVALQFHSVPHLPFKAAQARGLHPNTLILRIQPDEGITLCFGAKVPGQDFTLRSVAMDFSYSEAFPDPPPDAYERLLLDALVGDPTLFIRSDEVLQAWRICDPILEAFANGGVPLSRYPVGSWGPAEADRLIERDGRHWREP